MSPVNGQIVSHSLSTTAPSAPVTDTAAIRELLGMMKASLGTLGQTFRTLNEQSAKVATLGPSMQDTHVQIQALQRQIRSQGKKQDLRVKEVKYMIKNDLKDQVAEELRDHIRNTIKSEVAIQVKEQVDKQMPEHLPVSPKQQAEESKRHLIEVRHALVNSEARRANSVLRTSNLDDSLAVVLKPDGTRSDVYPADLRSLFSYDTHMIRALLKDYELVEHEHREKILNRFMSHIGVSFQLVAIPLEAVVSDIEPSSPEDW